LMLDTQHVPPTMTARDAVLLKDLARLRVMPLAHVLERFPTAGAGYVRVGELDRRGLLQRFTWRGERWVGLGPVAARLWHVPSRRGALTVTDRRCYLARADWVLRHCGFAAIAPPNRAPQTFVYYGREGRVIAMGVALRPLQRGRLRNWVHALTGSLGIPVVQELVVFAPGVTVERLHELPATWASRIIVMPLPGPELVSLMRTQLLLRLA